jgi:hypothetical protein
MRGRSRRDAVKEQFWRKAIARLAASGLTKRQFCKQQGLSLDVLRYWTAAIAVRDKERESVEPFPNKIAAETFLPVTVSLQKSDDQVIGIQQLAVAEIVVTEGCVRLFNGISPDTVRSLWLALREGIK